MTLVLTLGCSGSKTAGPDMGVATGSKGGAITGPDRGTATEPDNGVPRTCTEQTGGCDPLGITGPSIGLSKGSSLIAAIETSGGCGISWSTRNMAATMFKDAPSSSCSSGSPCLHYDCIPQNDGGHGCTGAWIHTGVSCSVTVIPITGESQSFEVTATKPWYHNYCWTGTGQCVDNTSLASVWPVAVTLTFAQSDASAGPNGIADLADQSFP